MHMYRNTRTAYTNTGVHLHSPHTHTHSHTPRKLIKMKKVTAKSDIFLDHVKLQEANHCVCSLLMQSSRQATELHRVSVFFSIPLTVSHNNIQHCLKQSCKINHVELNNVTFTTPQHYNCCVQPFVNLFQTKFRR